MGILDFISTSFYFLKNKVKPVNLPKYKWIDRVVTFSNIRNKDNQAYIKFYATKNWVEIYIINSANVDYLDSNLISKNNHSESLIIPKWKVISYEPYNLKNLIGTDTEYVMNFVWITKNDYKRYQRWHK
jgi:hypothetical protein